MTLDCRQVRGRVLASRRSDDVHLEAHLEACRSCADFAVRMEHVRSGLEAHHAAAEPDPGFAVRLRARLEGGDGATLDTMARWALGMLPAAIAIAAALTWFAAREGALAPTAWDPEPTAGDATLEWILADEAETP